MCGILGWVLPHSRRQDDAVLRRLLGTIRHRGPDAEGVFIENCGDNQVALGHRRLSIIDLSAGAQPMQSADGRITLVFNGEIYNYVELRQDLIQRGHVFRTSSDTEVLIEAYRAFGAAALDRLRGMFAFALWDSDRRTLLMARDPFGKKPLFLTHAGNDLLFASEIEPLLQFPGQRRRFNRDALGGYLANRYVPGPETFFRNIEKLPPGSYATFSDAGLCIRRYFAPPLATTEPQAITSRDAAARVRSVLEDAVRIRMRSDAPYGAYLSGGIDSSAVVAIMAATSSSPVRTFSVGFSEQRYSELASARMVADRFGSDHHELVVTPEMFLEAWPDAVRHRAAPVTEASDIPILLLSREASRHVKMVLTGEGADEMLAGYPKHGAEPWVRRYQKMIPAPLHRHLFAPAFKRVFGSARRLKIAFEAAGERDFSRRMQFWFGGTPDETARSLLRGQPALATNNPFPYSLQSASALRRMLFFDQTSWLPDNLLERGDRMMMAGSIEGRMPFMDTEFAKVAASLPDHLLLGGNGGKSVLRQALRDILPREIRTRKKVGFRVPFDVWLKNGPCRDMLRDFTESENSRIAHLFDKRILAALVGDFLTGRQPDVKTLWSLMNLELFLRLFGIDTQEFDQA